MAFLQSLNRDNIDDDFYEELENIFISLSDEQKLKLDDIIKNSDTSNIGEILYLLGGYHESQKSKYMFNFYYLSLNANYLPAFHRLATIAYSRKQYEEGDNYLLAAIAKNDKEAMILLGSKYRLIDKNYQLAEKYFVMAMSYLRLGDLYYHDYSKKKDALNFYLEGIKNNDEHCFVAVINNYLYVSHIECQAYKQVWRTNRKKAHLLLAEFLEKSKSYKNYKYSLYFYSIVYNLHNAYELSLLHEKYQLFGMNNEFYLFLANNIKSVN